MYVKPSGTASSSSLSLVKLGATAYEVGGALGLDALRSPPVAGLNRLLHFGETLVRGFGVGFRLRSVHDAFAPSCAGTSRARSASADALVHHRLRYAGSSRFVVAIAAVADPNDHDVGWNFSRYIIARRTAGRPCFGVVRIDVDDRRHQREIASE